jgi:hypothetical protein
MDDDLKRLRSTADKLGAEIRRLNPESRPCPECNSPLVLIGRPLANEKYWTCPGGCDDEEDPIEASAGVGTMLNNAHSDLEIARAKAERNNLTWYLWMGSVVVMDAGKRARLCSSGEFTVEGHNWETAPGCSGSMRTATDEEQELWRALP